MRIVEFTQPTHIFIDLDEMAAERHDARGDLRVPADRDEGRACRATSTRRQPGVADEPAFIAAFPSEMLEDLPCLQGKLPDHGSKDTATDQG